MHADVAAGQADRTLPESLVSRRAPHSYLCRPASPLTPGRVRGLAARAGRHPILRALRRPLRPARYRRPSARRNFGGRLRAFRRRAGSYDPDRRLCAALARRHRREASLAEESFENSLLEYPRYTRPRVWEGLEIPDVLLSGDHARIARWRRELAERVTRRTPSRFAFAEARTKALPGNKRVMRRRNLFAGKARKRAHTPFALK